MTGKSRQVRRAPKALPKNVTQSFGRTNKTQRLALSTPRTNGTLYNVLEAIWTRPNRLRVIRGMLRTRIPT
jgi:hypothetical protein